ncbi:hypothetical protein EGR_08288 [Echinococcus granulosus]|uniref:Uncharacterized protein n=1 Tax=Echinococcus granulosus TaxID=6210 RepID=W6UFG4_ECHGR|nr:hypothetical protein EGR_08288 [Echinococcus granulosus]EUB56882.1 hypothetical protein EGR_08288 [Echinococcus granulosus]
MDSPIQRIHASTPLSSVHRLHKLKSWSSHQSEYFQLCKRFAPSTYFTHTCLIMNLHLDASMEMAGTTLAGITFSRLVRRSADEKREREKITLASVSPSMESLGFSHLLDNLRHLKSVAADLSGIEIWKIANFSQRVTTLEGLQPNKSNDLTLEVRRGEGNLFKVFSKITTLPAASNLCLHSKSIPTTGSHYAENAPVADQSDSICDNHMTSHSKKLLTVKYTNLSLLPHFWHFRSNFAATKWFTSMRLCIDQMIDHLHGNVTNMSDNFTREMRRGKVSSKLHTIYRIKDTIRPKASFPNHQPDEEVPINIECFLAFIHFTTLKTTIKTILSNGSDCKVTPHQTMRMSGNVIKVDEHIKTKFTCGRRVKCVKLHVRTLPYLRFEETILPVPHSSLVCLQVSLLSILLLLPLTLPSAICYAKVCGSSSTARRMF